MNINFVYLLTDLGRLIQKFPLFLINPSNLEVYNEIRTTDTYLITKYMISYHKLIAFDLNLWNR